MRTHKKNYILFIPLLLLHSCISPVEIQIEGMAGQLAISGQISTREGRTHIQIGRTAREQLHYAVANATVLIVDEQGNQTVLPEYDSGNYKLPGFEAIAGNMYHIEITLTTGEEYRSQPELVPTDTLPLELHYAFGEERMVNAEGATITQKNISLYATTTLNELKNVHVGYSVNETFIVSPTDFPDPFGSIPPPCFIDQKAEPNRIAQLSTRNINGSKIENILICKRNIDWTFLEKHYFTAYQSIISEEAFHYLNKINTLANQTGSIFDTPPAHVRGNLHRSNNPSEVVLGYVQCVNESAQRILLYPSDFPFPIFFPTENCTYDPNRIEPYTRYCINCLFMRNSSLQRPDWF